jgi:hypothetical protein
MLKTILILLSFIITLSGCQFNLIKDTAEDPVISVATPIPSILPQLADLNLDRPSDTYLSGTLVNIKSDQWVITTSLGSLYTVHLTPQTKLRKASRHPSLLTHRGDFIEVTGSIDHKSKITYAEEIWINFMRVTGKLSEVQHTPYGIQFWIHDVRQGMFLAMLNQDTRVAIDGVDRSVHLEEISWEEIKFADVHGFKQAEDTLEAITVFLGYD